MPGTGTPGHLMAANATFALKAGSWLRRARLVILAPDPRHPRRSQADFPLIGLSEFPRPLLPDGFADPRRGGGRRGRGHDGADARAGARQGAGALPVADQPLVWPEAIAQREGPRG